MKPPYIAKLTEELEEEMEHAHDEYAKVIVRKELNPGNISDTEFKAAQNKYKQVEARCNEYLKSLPPSTPRQEKEMILFDSLSTVTERGQQFAELTDEELDTLVELLDKAT